MEVELPALERHEVWLLPVLVGDGLWDEEPALEEPKWLHDPGDGPVGRDPDRRDEHLVAVCRKLVAALPSVRRPYDPTRDLFLEDPTPAVVRPTDDVAAVPDGPSAGVLSGVPDAPPGYVVRRARTSPRWTALRTAGSLCGAPVERHDRHVHVRAPGDRFPRLRSRLVRRRPDPARGRSSMGRPALGSGPRRDHRHPPRGATWLVGRLVPGRGAVHHEGGRPHPVVGPRRGAPGWRSPGELVGLRSVGDVAGCHPSVRVGGHLGPRHRRTDRTRRTGGRGHGGHLVARRHLRGNDRQFRSRDRSAHRRGFRHPHPARRRELRHLGGANRRRRAAQRARRAGAVRSRRRHRRSDRASGPTSGRARHPVQCTLLSSERSIGCAGARLR